MKLKNNIKKDVFEKYDKILKVMKISIILLFIGAFGLTAENVHSQNKELSLKATNITIEKAISKIEKDNGYVFIYNEDVVSELKKQTSFEAKHESIKNVLDKLFAEADLAYNIIGKQITVYKKKASVISLPAIGREQQNPQNGITVKGKVVDAKGEPVIGATIVVQGDATKGAVTDVDGRYTLTGIPENATLVITYVGMKPQSVPLNGRTTLDVTLEEDTELLDEVVVIGYGTQRKVDLTGSVANIKSDKLTTQSNVNIGQALQGKIAGVDIVSQGGAPGQDSRIMVRGIGTLNNANPLYIVDGMYMTGMDHINPNDIESIDVLKDASSAAIYGSRAANGVIIVTTKSGLNTEGKPIIDISANVGLQTPSKYMDMLNAADWTRLTGVSRQTIGLAPLQMAVDSKENNDWQRIMMGHSIMQNYNLTVRGGSKHFTYYTGAGFVDQEGIIKGTNYKRYNLQFKSEYKRGWFTFGNNIVFSARQNNPLYEFARGGYLGIILQSIPTLQQYDPSNKKGGYGKVYGDATDIPNPLGILDNNLTQRTWNKYNAYINLYAEVALPYGFKYRLNMTPDMSFDRGTTYENVFDFGLRNNAVSNMREYRNQSNNFLIENLLSFDKTFNKHKVTALLGYSYQSYRNRYIMAAGKGLPDGIREVGAATQDRLNDTWKKESALTSIISRIFYSYDNRYLLTATYRRDGSSKFAKNNRYGHFPSLSVGWNVAEEQFMAKTRNWLDQFKLRAGYGVLGNQEIDDYLYTSVVTANINYPDGKGGLISGAFPKEFANPAIRWEETAMSNIGVDLAFLNSRLTITSDWYQKDTKDILLTVPIPISTGGANDPVRNAGKIKNTGFEWTIGWNNVPTKDFSYGVTLTGNAMKNEVVAMGDANQVINGGTNRTNVSTTKTLAGYPIGGFWLIPTDGLFQSQEEIAAYSKNGSLIQPNAKPGDIRFKDSNGDGRITDDDRVYLGSPFPTLTMGLSFNATYKDFDMLVGTQGVFGNKIYNATRLELEGVNKGTNFLASTLDYWTLENKNASHPRLVWDDPNQNMRPQSDRFLEDGSFFRLRNIQLGYTFPQAVFQNKIQKMRVYINAENLFTITKYKGYTPDINSGEATSRGFDNFVYPTNRIFMLGLNLTF